MRSDPSRREQAQRYLLESADIKCRTADQCIAAILAGNLGVDDFVQETNQFLLGLFVAIVIVADRHRMASQRAAP